MFKSHDSLLTVRSASQQLLHDWCHGTSKVQYDTVRDASSRVTECESHVMLNRYPKWSVAGVNLFESMLAFSQFLLLQWYVLKKKGARRLWWLSRLNSLIHICLPWDQYYSRVWAVCSWHQGTWEGRFAAVSKKINQDELHQIFTHGPSNFLLEWGLWNGMVSQSKKIQLSVIQFYTQQFQQRKQNQSVLLVAKALDPFVLSRDDPDARLFRTSSSPWSVA